MKKYFIKTFGCQMNHSDSERIAGFLELEGLAPAKDINSADIAIFNTCGVRQMAEDRVYGQIHNLATRNSKRVTIILTGCLANRKDVQRRLRDKVDLFCAINDFPEKITSHIRCHPELACLSGRQVSGSRKMPKQVRHDNTYYLSLKPKYKSPHTAYVPIMTGCNNFCSYCVVPYARGREVSRPAEDIIKEVKSLVKKGYKEIILLGQNVNSYNYEFRSSNFEINSNDLILKRSDIKNSKLNRNSSPVTFPQLLKMANDIPGNFWVWFVSNHPKDFSDELIETMTKCQKVCECVHLPIQAGDDKVLQSMNRKYTTKEYLKLIEKIKKAFAKNKPGKIFSITSDIIVGFPGETKKQFLQSASVMKKVSYDMVFFGQFSRRPGTAAWKMKDNVKKAEKVRRERYLNEILKKTAFANNKKYVDKEVEVIIDKEKDDFYYGRTRTYKNVKIISNHKNLVGKIIKARITKANIWSLEGKIA